MKLVARQSNKKAAFTIVELLTVMSIIIILIGLLVPSLNLIRKYAKTVKQKNQFHGISVQLELFNAEEEGYPPSDAEDGATPPQQYCGAMKLCEAMMGQDLLGFHPNSRFRSDGTTDGTAATQLYPVKGSIPDADYNANLKARRGPYLQLENANAYKLKNLYGTGATGLFDENRFVLCDVYTRVRHLETGKKIGMPILYYKANTSNTEHDLTDENNTNNIYNYKDNDILVQLGLPWNSSIVHHIDSTGGLTSDGGTSNAIKFYEYTWNENVTSTSRPYRADSYILISAGFDGEYGPHEDGESDDVFNFGD